LSSLPSSSPALEEEGDRLNWRRIGFPLYIGSYIAGALSEDAVEADLALASTKLKLLPPATVHGE
jgi:hypothetical protein